MKSLIAATLTVALAGSLFAEDAKKETAPSAEAPAKAEGSTSGKFANENEKISYALGVDVGGGLKGLKEQFGVDLKPELAVKGLQDALKGELAMSEAEVQEAIQQLNQIVQTKQMERMKKMAEENAAASAKFLEENKKKEGVKVTPSGIQYKVLTEGKGDKPATGDTVVVHYKGTLVDGTVFDETSVEKGPAELVVGEVFPGWDEAIQLMPVGSKWQLVFPSELGAGSGMGPGQLVIFDVELLEIKKGDKKDEKKDDAKKEEKKGE